MTESPAHVHENIDHAIRRLDVLGVFNRTWLEVFRCRVPLLKALLVPSIALAALDYLDSVLIGTRAGASLGITLVALLIWATFAVSCHRILLIGPANGPAAWGLYLSRPVFHYFGYTVLLLLFLVLLWIGATFLVHLVVETPERAPARIDQMYGTAREVLEILLTPWLLYIVARFALILPARALADDAIMEEVWSWSRGNGWRVLLAILMPAIAVAIVLLPVLWIRNGLDHPLMSVPLAIVVNLVCAVCVAAISCTYKALRPHDEATLVSEPAAEPATTIV